MVTDQQLLEAIQYAVHEPPDGGATWPCEVWTRAEVVSYANQRQNRFLKETHLLVTIAPFNVSAGTTEITLPADWIRTRRVMWYGSDGIVQEVPRADSFEADYGFPATDTPPSWPQMFSEFETPTLTMRLLPPPGVAGILELDYVALAAAFDPVTPGAVVTLPDDFSYVVKYGALAEMFGKDGRMNDVTRAQYCEQRFQLAVDTARMLLEGWA